MLCRLLATVSQRALCAGKHPSFHVYFVFKIVFSRLPPLLSQLWEALMTWCSKLKSKAHDIVPHFYKLGNQFSSDENLAIAQDLIRGSSFMQDGVNEEVSHVQQERTC